jgi:superfamily II DNA or RNA helicase
LGEQYIVVDEFHHAAAPSYRKLLEYYEPKILLGLTATPERMDGKSILSYFGDRIAAEIRLPEAIDRKLLCPFQYFGITDTVDLSTLHWTKGGYDKGELSNIYTFSGMAANKRADLVITSILKYVTDINNVKGLGFCVSVEHAEFMARYFNEHDIPSIHLTGKSSDEERKQAKNQLVSGKVRFIFVVDIYNEGVDIPEVNTVLFLRPTESLTVFLQQLGRGLRLSENKDCLTVLDFRTCSHRRLSSK